MNEANPARGRVEAVAVVMVVLGMGFALYMTFTEPFTGTSVGFAGRVLGPIAVALIALSRLLPRRWRAIAAATGLVAGLAAFALILAGRSPE